MNRLLIFVLSLTMISCEGQKKPKQNSSDQRLKTVKKQIEILSTEKDSLENRLNDLNSKFNSITHLSTGEFQYIENDESDVFGENYRVEIYQSEIYRSLYITRIEFYGEGGQRITSRNRLEFESITGTTEEQTSTMKFIEWIDFDKFRINSNKQNYHIEIIDPNSFRISEE